MGSHDCSPSALIYNPGLAFVSWVSFAPAGFGSSLVSMVGQPLSGFVHDLTKPRHQPAHLQDSAAWTHGPQIAGFPLGTADAHCSQHFLWALLIQALSLLSPCPHEWRLWSLLPGSTHGLLTCVPGWCVPREMMELKIMCEMMGLKMVCKHGNADL